MEALRGETLSDDVTWRRAFKIMMEKKKKAPASDTTAASLFRSRRDRHLRGHVTSDRRRRPHLALLERRHLLLQRDVLLLQLGVVLQQAGLQQLVLLDVVTQMIPLELHHLAVLLGGGGEGGRGRRRKEEVA